MIHTIKTSFKTMLYTQDITAQDYIQFLIAVFSISFIAGMVIAN